MSELAIAVFAAEAGEHVLDVPRSRRFDVFRRSFDDHAYRRRLDGRRRLAGSAAAMSRFPRGYGQSTTRRRACSLARLSPPDLGGRPTVAIVGARACSSYGSSVAQGLARELAAAGVVIVSGLARGVDAAAHRGALEAGTTVAVLGCGDRSRLPTAHTRSLAAEIAQRGLIVSEYAPGVEPAPWRFPARNRIVAGLADATVVVEARERSGALITADLALDEGREVLAVPGEITNRAVTRHERSAAARCHAGHVCRRRASRRSACGRNRAQPGTTGDERLERVRALLADAPASVDELVRQTGSRRGAARGRARRARAARGDRRRPRGGVYRAVVHA